MVGLFHGPTDLDYPRRLSMKNGWANEVAHGKEPWFKQSCSAAHALLTFFFFGWCTHVSLVGYVVVILKSDYSY